MFLSRFKSDHFVLCFDRLCFQNRIYDSTRFKLIWVVLRLGATKTCRFTTLSIIRQYFRSSSSAFAVFFYTSLTIALFPLSISSKHLLNRLILICPKFQLVFIFFFLSCVLTVPPSVSYLFAIFDIQPLDEWKSVALIILPVRLQKTQRTFLMNRLTTQSSSQQTCRLTWPR